MVYGQFNQPHGLSVEVPQSQSGERMVPLAFSDSSSLPKAKILGGTGY